MEALKRTQILPKVLARMFNDMWDIVLICEEDDKKLAVSVITTKSVQTEYMGTRKISVTLHEVPMVLTEERLGVFSKYGEVEDVSASARKMGIVTGDYLLQITMSRKYFMDIPDILSCRGRNILVIVEGRRPHCWFFGVVGHL